MRNKNFCCWNTKKEKLLAGEEGVKEKSTWFRRKPHEWKKGCLSGDPVTTVKMAEIVESDQN